MDINSSKTPGAKEIKEEQKTTEETSGSSNFFYLIAGLCVLSFILSCIFFGLYVSAAGSRSAQEMATQKERERGIRIDNITSDQSKSAERYTALVASEKSEHKLWKEKNANLNKTKDYLKKYISEMTSSLATSTTINNILMYATIGTGALNIPGLIIDYLASSAYSSTLTEYNAAVATNEELSRLISYINSDLSSIRSKTSTPIQQLLGLFTAGCWVKSDLLYNSTAHGWSKATFRTKVAEKENTLIYAMAGGVMLGGLVRVKWPKADDNTLSFLEDAKAETFSSKSIGFCTVQNKQHAIRLNTAGALFEFGEAELLIFENATGRASGGHDYTCSGTTNPHEFYYPTRSIPKVDFVMVYQFSLTNEAACKITP